MKKGKQIVYTKYFPLGYNVFIFPLAVYSSDVIVQIVDARNPLLFRCEDLESYVLEVDANKTNVLLVNKADYLTEKQRLAWLEYFETLNVKVIFWSAKMANDAEKLNATDTISENSQAKSNETIDEDDEEDEADRDDEDDEEEDEDEKDDDEEDQQSDQATGKTTAVNKHNVIVVDENSSLGELSIENLAINEKCKILTREELIDLLKSIHTNPVKVKPGCTTIGMVGYPNVGKSSTINALLQRKRVAVSETPGKTKHYQVSPPSSDVLQYMLC